MQHKVDTGLLLPLGNDSGLAQQSSLYSLSIETDTLPVDGK